MEMREIVARGIARAHFTRQERRGTGPNLDQVGNLVERYWRQFTEEAFTAVSDMRDPTEAMIAAARGLTDPVDIWRAMIDRAKAGGSELGC